MQTRSAIFYEGDNAWTVETLEIDEPRSGEVLVRMAASGICHSDDHALTGDIPRQYYPFCGGHEGAGVVEAIGPGVTAVAVGDHVVSCFIPSCGRCKWCASGRQNLCDRGAGTLKGRQIDGTFRMHLDTMGVGAGTSTFTELTVTSERSLIAIPHDIDLTTACLLGCAVPTGWGAAVNGAAVSPGDIVIVMGVGGVGMNAVQGAWLAGAQRVIAVDPAQFKRDSAPIFGATDTAASIEEATELARDLTNGQGADAAIVATGVVKGSHIAEAFAAIAKGGIVVVAGVGPIGPLDVKLDVFELAMYQKRIQGVLFGMCSPARDIPRLVDLYRDRRLLLDELITNRYTLDTINQGFEDMHHHRNIRGVIEISGVR